MRRLLGKGLTWLGQRLLGVDPEVRPFVRAEEEDDVEHPLPVGHPVVTYGPRAMAMREQMHVEEETPPEAEPLIGSVADRLRHATEKG